MKSALNSLFIFLILTGSAAAGGGSTNHFGFSSTLPNNPLIQAMLDSVSGDSLEYYLNNLVGFHTRHSNSDTNSSTIGIGAARRWIHGSFKRWSERAGISNTTPGYFVFDRTICGITGSHRNVTETITGGLYPDRYYVITGHMDSRMQDVCNSTSFAPGANDDGSGTAVVIELARILSQYEFDSSFLLMPVTGEDQGLHGSTAYADYALANGIDIGGMITNDIVGNILGDNGITDSTHVRHFSGPPDNGTSRQLTRYIKLKAESYDSTFIINLIRSIDRPGRSGDHVPFYNNGYPAVRFTEPNENGDGSGDNGRQHNEFDLVEFMNMGYLSNITKTNIAAFATLALAPKGPAPISIRQLGDGSSLRLDWQADNPEPDFAGYRIAMRFSADPFYFDIVDAGNADSILIDGLTPGEEIYFSISAYDTSGNESVFSIERAVVPSEIPIAPRALDITSKKEGPLLEWRSNDELDLAGYVIHRSVEDTLEFIAIDTVDFSESEYTDVQAATGTLYYYRISALDSSGNQSLPTANLKGRKAGFDSGIMIVDGSKDGNGTVLKPFDEDIDLYYERITSGFNVTNTWDLIENAALDNRLSDADLVPYSTVVFHAEIQGLLLEEDGAALAKYLSSGGKLLISGWALSESIGGERGLLKSFEAGNIFNLFHIDSILTSGAGDVDFVNALSAHAEYSDLRIDSVKIPIFDNHLLLMDGFVEPFTDPAVEVIYTYNSSLGGSSELHGKPVGTRFSGSVYSYVLLDVPLFFMNESDARLALITSLEFFNEIFTSVDEEDEVFAPKDFRIGNPYPNPFNPIVNIAYTAPEAGSLRAIIYDLLGRRVKAWEVANVERGSHKFRWHGKTDSGVDAVSGIYFLKMDFTPRGSNRDNKTSSGVRKLVLLR